MRKKLGGLGHQLFPRLGDSTGRALCAFRHEGSSAVKAGLDAHRFASLVSHTDLDPSTGWH